MSKITRKFALTGLSTLFGLIVASSWDLQKPVKAAESSKNPYEMGLQFYQKGDYVKARHYLEHVTKLKPTFWPAHYALGNTYLKTGNLELAKVSYMNCLIQKPDVPTCKNCSKAMEYLNIAIAEKQKSNEIIPAETQEKIALVEENAKRENDTHEALVKSLTEKREKILADGQKQVAAIRARYEEQFRWLDENSNERWRNRETGEFGVGLTKETQEELCAERDEEIKRVMELAESRARGIQIPSAPSMATSLPFSNVHSNSNIYVRHYKHTSTHSNKHNDFRKVATGAALTK